VLAAGTPPDLGAVFAVTARPGLTPARAARAIRQASEIGADRVSETARDDVFSARPPPASHPRPRTGTIACAIHNEVQALAGPRADGEDSQRPRRGRSGSMGLCSPSPPSTSST
jgi:hypothetical protein